MSFRVWAVGRVGAVGVAIVVLACTTASLVAQNVVLDPTRLAGAQNRLVQISPDAKELGFNPAKLNTIDRQLEAKVGSGEIVGCNALILRGDREVYYGQWGDRNRELQKPLARETIFRIYSMSKPIVSLAAMQLVEQGKLDLELPISHYLPEFKNLKVLETRNRQVVEVAPKREMTTRDLLRHTSGLTYGHITNTSIDRRYQKAGLLVTGSKIEQTVSKLSEIPLLNHPGSKFVYSISTDVLGRVVEVVSKQTLAVYLKQNIFEPLEMDDTSFTVPLNELDRLAQLYKPAGRKNLDIANPLLSFRFVNPFNEYYSGGGGLASTIDDYANFCRMLLNEGKFNRQHIVEPETLKQMFTNQLETIENPPARFKFGLGFRIFPNGDLGWGGVAGTRFWVNPEKNMAVIYMVQIMPYGNRTDHEIVHDAAYRAFKGTR